ncbi:hypothetical protein PHYPSEUDO_003253 [Phytophthora pseudosyringae]|uniref:Uncharacterized protein n=1 Tax=Phytophthora pseudosyringae TaxID=221518 RepID=A0A8T1VV24_9STRA|nr:hypothetical protein PHYPSEUDO_003253 [Phytophthora pseudosyringae]
MSFSFGDLCVAAVQTLDRTLVRERLCQCATLARRYATESRDTLASACNFHKTSVLGIDTINELKAAIGAKTLSLKMIQPQAITSLRDMRDKSYSEAMAKILHILPHNQLNHFQSNRNIHIGHRSVLLRIVGAASNTDALTSATSAATLTTNVETYTAYADYASTMLAIVSKQRAMAATKSCALPPSATQTAWPPKTTWPATDRFIMSERITAAGYDWSAGREDRRGRRDGGVV